MKRHSRFRSSNDRKKTIIYIDRLTIVELEYHLNRKADDRTKEIVKRHRLATVIQGSLLDYHRPMIVRRQCNRQKKIVQRP